MTTTTILPKTDNKNLEPESQPKLENTAEIQTESKPEKVISLEEFLVKPPDRMEWVDGKLEEKTGITFKHGLAQSKLSTSWGNYKNSSKQGGEVVIGVLCRTGKQCRRPDVAHITYFRKLD